MKEKLTSRKFWVCVAAFLSSLGMSIAGLATTNQYIVIVGMVCTVVSASIYATLEALLDYEKEEEKNDVIS